jgi:hypothetical protein
MHGASMRTTLTIDPEIAHRLLPGIDPTRLNQLVDELEVDAFIAKRGPRS